jgi:hypothetical protein
MADGNSASSGTEFTDPGNNSAKISSLLLVIIKQVVERRLEGMFESVAQAAWDMIEAHPAQVWDQQALRSLVEVMVGDELSGRGDAIDLEMVKAWVRKSRPEVGPMIAEGLTKCGLNREKDYIWARPSDGPRDEGGALLRDVFVIIEPANALISKA